MFDPAQACAKAQAFFADGDPDHGLTYRMYVEPVAQSDEAYVFCCQSLRFMDTGNIADAIVGCLSVIVDKQTGKAVTFGSGLSVDEALLNYRQTGTPYQRLGRSLSIAVFGKSQGVLDQFCRGQNFKIEAATIEQAIVLASRLEGLGLKVQRLAEAINRRNGHD